MVGPSSLSGGPVPSRFFDETLCDIGDRVRAERQARGWSQPELARRAGICKATVHRLESDGGIHLRHLIQACWALGVSPERLLSADWRFPDRGPVLTPQQVVVLREVASGDSLAEVGSRLGMARGAVSSVLTRVYQRLDVSHVPVGERRSAACRVAMQYGLFTSPNRTS